MLRNCLPVDGMYDGQPRFSCLYCGKWLDELKLVYFDESKRYEVAA